MLSDNRIDPASHRGFPTVWRSLSYYLGLGDAFNVYHFFKNINLDIEEE